MDKKWIRRNMAVVGALVVMVFGASLAAAGVGTLVSQVIEVTNTVEGMPVGLSLVNIDTQGLDGVDEHANWSSGTLYQLVTYDTGVNVSSVVAFDAIYLYIEVSAANVSESDVSLSWYSESAVRWYDVALTDSGDVLTGIIGPATGFSVTDGYGKIFPVLITFNTGGNYTTNIWAESL